MMKSFYKAIGVLAFVAMVALGSATRVEALVISIDPATQDAVIGDSVFVDIVASDITDPIGAFFFLIGFDDTILQGVDFTNDPGGTMGPAAVDLSFGFGAGEGDPSRLDLFFVADPASDETDLGGAQGSSFILATIEFLAIANGLSPIQFLQFDVSNWDGNETLAAQAVDGEVCVGGRENCQVAVPEPATLSLFGFGGLGLLAVRRRRQARS